MLQEQRWGGRLGLARAGGRGELHRKVDLPHESHYNKDEAWKGSAVQAHVRCKLSNTFGKERNPQEALRSVC